MNLRYDFCLPFSLIGFVFHRKQGTGDKGQLVHGEVPVRTLAIKSEDKQKKIS